MEIEGISPSWQSLMLIGKDFVPNTIKSLKTIKELKQEIA